ncbi:N-acetyl-gamma-glutamyl-phosphate reductase [Fulvivirga maritima]|uniref:N-acetyl-gamma-glutamyl-phosphate reductase n=1 Tax=Fulvivirga maritima TaxID=2904247 RepID=UPI001F2E6C4A|nr:N-acetyl-gamma-glutamyl-phosphate reductase [Fulvivirga maritima]UII29417.1 N-acetyl-gamma-glutamyl-phosphate reductase [Fulvivirga maritima]
MSNTRKKVAIVGASGYTGSELARFLLHHPEVEIAMITSETHEGKPFSTLHPQFTGQLDMPLVSAQRVTDEPLDVVFLALPHGVSMNFVMQWADKSFKIIDLSGDFRLKNSEVYEHWYKKDHNYEKGFDHAVYGLPELHKDDIVQSDLVANPGCYPTTSTLGVAPLVAEKLIDIEGIIIDAKSGITGAGIKPSLTTHFSNVNDNFKAYGVKSHRHTIEIEEQLGFLNEGEVKVQFTPHLLPLDRGILATSYSTPLNDMTQEKLDDLYQSFYEEKPFVRVRESLPTLKDVRGSNYCDVHPVWDERTNRIMVFSAIDNLVKGAAGQAIQNMNLMLGFEETSGLLLNPLKP